MKKYVYKKSIFAFIDMLKAKKLPIKVLKKIKLINNPKIKTNFHINNLANLLHPEYIKTKVIKKEYLINNRYIYLKLIPTNENEKFPFFRAGQYISLVFNINQTKISRPFSIVSSPYDAIKHGFIEIIIKIEKNGFISNYIDQNINVNSEILIQGPFGEFYHDSIRDTNHIIGMTSGIGITPFLSMIKSIIEKSENFKLTLFIFSRDIKNIIYYDNLKSIANNYPDIFKLVPIINTNINEQNILVDFSHHHIKQYFVNNKNSIFLCGSKHFYRLMNKPINDLNLEQKYIRYEKSNQIGPPTNYNDYQNYNNKIVYKIIVKQQNNIYHISGHCNDTILISLQKAKISSFSNCLRGTCGWCRFKLISGTVYTPHFIINERKADILSNVYLSCSSFPTSDIEIEVY